MSQQKESMHIALNLQQFCHLNWMLGMKPSLLTLMDPQQLLTTQQMLIFLMIGVSLWVKLQRWTLIQRLRQLEELIINHKGLVMPKFHGRMMMESVTPIG